MYTEYAYSFQKGTKVPTLTFSLKATQCGNYPEKEMQECDAERDAFNIDTIVDRIAQTLQLK